MTYLFRIAIAIALCSAISAIAQTPSVYEQGLNLARTGRFQEAARILSEAPNASRSAAHHYVLAVCYAKLDQSDMALSSVTSSLQIIPGLPFALQSDAISLLRWAAFSEGTRNVKVVSVLERFKMSTPATSTDMDMLEQAGLTAQHAAFIELQVKLGKFGGIEEVFRDVDRARNCRNWQGEMISDAQGLPIIVAVECTADGVVTVVYGGALGALFESYASKRTSLALP